MDRPPKIYFDLETQIGFTDLKDAGLKIHQMPVSVGVAMTGNDYFVFTEKQIGELIDLLWMSQVVIGFNVENFDYTVLGGYAAEWERAKANAIAQGWVSPLATMPMTFDLFQFIRAQTKQWASLDSLGQKTLGENKIWDGAQVVDFWKKRKLDQVIEHCKQDVYILKKLHETLASGGVLKFTAKRSGKDFEVRL
jgi:DEAD/DEAH box helicase domain-containing protein